MFVTESEARLCLTGDAVQTGDAGTVAAVPVRTFRQPEHCAQKV